MMRQLGYLAAGSFTLAILLAAPAWFLDGLLGILHVAVAWLLCLVPMAGTLLWCHWSAGAAHEQQLTAALGSTGLRLLLVCGLGIALHQNVPAFQHAAFLIWVIVFYLTTLVLEVFLLARRQPGLTDLLSAQPQQPRN